MTIGWEAVKAALDAARGQIVAAAPDAETEAEGEAYLARVLATFLNDAFLGHLTADGGLIRALGTRGGTNPDYQMYIAMIDPARSYRLTGRLNDSERAGIGLNRFGAGGSVEISSYAAFDRASTDSEGGFTLRMAADAEGPDSLKMHPDARLLIIRILHRDPDGTPARVMLSGGPPVNALTLLGGSNDAALGYVARSLTNTVQQFLEWSALTSAHPNQFVTDTSSLSQTVLGDADTQYFLGYFNLAEGEWLEVTLPAGLPGYWSLHAYNHWLEILPGASAHDRNIVPADGEISVAIGPNPPPEAVNRMNTLGRRQGVLICRVIGADEMRAPQTRLHRKNGVGEKAAFV